jgi:demethylmenaquinone methyltransferase/2-methoxy-6-polyprenyl-1,4-benzoquinol methylase
MQRGAESNVWQLSGSERREAVKTLFGAIASRYDLLNSAMSLRLHHRWREAAVGLLDLKRGESVADLCCGTGDFAPPIRAKVGGNALVLGLDFCLPMLQVAKSKNTAMELGVGDACAIPLASGSVDAVTVGWGLRNVTNLDGCLEEIRRILKPTGRFVSVDMAKPRNAFTRRLSALVFSTFAPAVGAMFGNKDAYKYLPKSTETFASRDELLCAFERAGFTHAGYKDMFLGNICIHWGRL